MSRTKAIVISEEWEKNEISAVHDDSAQRRQLTSILNGVIGAVFLYKSVSCLCSVVFKEYFFSFDISKSSINKVHIDILL